MRRLQPSRSVGSSTGEGFSVCEPRGGTKREPGRSAGLFRLVNPLSEEIAYRGARLAALTGIPVGAELEWFVELVLGLGVVQIGQHVRQGQSFRLWLAVVGKEA